MAKEEDGRPCFRFMLTRYCPYAPTPRFSPQSVLSMTVKMNHISPTSPPKSRARLIPVTR